MFILKKLDSQYLKRKTIFLKYSMDKWICVRKGTVWRALREVTYMGEGRKLRAGENVVS